MSFILLVSAIAALIAYLGTARRTRVTRIAIAAAIFLCFSGGITALIFIIGDKPLSGSVTVGDAPTGGTKQSPLLPAWVAALIERQPSGSRLIIEETLYQGRRAFLVMPPDRAFDSGNEHVLYSGDGRIICEFGGFAGHVTSGACDMDAIKYERTVFRQSGS